MCMTQKTLHYSNWDGKISTSSTFILSNNIPIASKILKVRTVFRSSTTRMHKIPTERETVTETATTTATTTENRNHDSVRLG
jgi:hypothetical protein